MISRQISDEELVDQCRRGESTRREIADELFARYYERVGRWCFRFIGNREYAADLAQEVFAKAYRRLESFRAEARFSTWLYAIARNECLSAIAAQAQEPDADGDEMLWEITDPSLSVADSLEHEEASKNVRRLLNEALEETERVVFTLHYADELPLDTITRLLHLTNASGAKAYIVSARRKLARAAARLRAKGTV